MATDTRPRTRPKPGKTAGDLGTGTKTGTGRPVSSPRHTRPFPPTKPQPTKRPDRTDRFLREQSERPLRSPARRVVGRRGAQAGGAPASPWRGGKQSPGAAEGKHLPFILLLVGLLGGAIVSLLVISTTLDAGAYRITNLTNQNASLNKEIQLVSNDVANERNPATLYGEAYRLGMRYDKNLRFIETKTGKISSSTPVGP